MFSQLARRGIQTGMVRTGVAKVGVKVRTMAKLPAQVCSKSKTGMGFQLRGFRSCAGTIPVSPYDLQKFEEMKKHLDDLSDEAKATLVDRVNWAVYRNTSVKKKQTNWYNQRHEYRSEKNSWEFMTKDELETHQKRMKSLLESERLKDLRYRSRYGTDCLVDLGQMNIEGDRKQRVAAADWIMFNKNFHLFHHQVDYALSMCRLYKEDFDHTQVDGWHKRVTNIYAHPNYKVYYDDSNMFDHDLVVSDEDKRLVVRALLTIMNETDPELVNHHNYQLLREWENLNCSSTQSHDIARRKIARHREEKETMRKEEEKESQLTYLDLNKPINRLCPPVTVLRILYEAAQEADDSISTLIKFVPPVSNSGLDRVIDDHQDQPIRTNPSDWELDLTEYHAVHGYYVTKRVIEQLDRKMEDKYWCADLTRGQVLAEMYNSKDGYGMGVLEAHKEGTMTVAYAENLVDTHTGYIGYYKGSAIKTSFRKFPLMCGATYDKYHGEGAFQQVLDNIRAGKTSSKPETGLSRIASEMVRMSQSLD